MGIIDYLQAYDWSKKGEHFLKSFKKGGDLISCIPPEPYQKRFYDFMSDHVFFNQKTQDSGTKSINLLKDQLKREKKEIKLKYGETELPWDLEEAEGMILLNIDV